jgi:hypothetical protein
MAAALGCKRQADSCLYMAHFAKDEQVMKSLLRDIARTWMSLACQIERMDVLRNDLAPYWATMYQLLSGAKCMLPDSVVRIVQ